MAKQTVPPLPLPKNWPQKVRSATVHAIALARMALNTVREPLLAQPMLEMTQLSAFTFGGPGHHRLFSAPQYQPSPTVSWPYPPPDWIVLQYLS
jgi:hypothetical protein